MRTATRTQWRSDGADALMALRVGAVKEGRHRQAVARAGSPEQTGRLGRPSTLLIGSVVETSPERARASAERALQQGADAVELRLDFLSDPLTDSPALVREVAGVADVVATTRASWEGGLYAGSESSRINVLLSAASAGAAFVDCELECEAASRIKCLLPDTTQLILSWHVFERSPPVDELMRAHSYALDADADVVKLAVSASRIEDVANVATALQQASAHQSPARTVGLAMGEAGVVTRLLAGKFGSAFTFGSVDGGSEAAPGQVTLHELRHLYGVQCVSRSTPVFGVIGNPVAHSRSPALHNRALAHAGVPGVYVPYLVQDLSSFIHTFPFNKQEFSGFSVTVPHKEAAIQVCSGGIDPVAKEIGAVNTLVRQSDGSLKGYNTDGQAAIDAIEMSLSGPRALAGKTLVVVGAGGAGRALAVCGQNAGANIIVANRGVERAQSLANDVGGSARAVSLDELCRSPPSADAEGTDVVLANTTSVGMQPNEHETPVSGSALSVFALVFDAVYAPLETTLLKDAKYAGCRVASGLDMFVGQAAKQFELFTGHEAPVSEMRNATLESLGYPGESQSSGER